MDSCLQGAHAKVNEPFHESNNGYLKKMRFIKIDGKWVSKDEEQASPSYENQAEADEEDQATPNTGDAGVNEHQIGQDDQGNEIPSEQDDGSCCAQILWIKQQLEHFGLKVNNVALLYDNTSAIKLTKNQIQHSRTKHIEIHHYFIRDHVSNEACKIQFIETKKQLANIFTKPLPRERFFFLRNELGILDFQNIS